MIEGRLFDAVDVTYHEFLSRGRSASPGTIRICFETSAAEFFEDVVMKAGLAVNPQYVAWGVGFVDFDSGGWLDVFPVNGHVFPGLASKPYKNPRVLYRNLGGGKFEDVSAMAGTGVAHRLAATPLRFAIASPPSGCEKDYHLQAVDHPRHTRKKASAEALAFRRVSRPVENYSEIFSTWTESPSTLPIIVTALP